MKLLAIETATDACSVAMDLDGQLIERETREPRAHAERVLEMVRECLGDAQVALADLDALVFGRGPGSFTGVRIAAGVVQGLALGSGLSVVPVSTLAGHAVAAWRQTGAHNLAVAVDARMGECYWGCFAISPEGTADLRGEELIASPADVSVPAGENWIGVGSGWQAFAELARAMPQVEVIVEPVLPSARDLLATAARAVARGETVSAEEALPVYLREKVAWQDPSSKN